MGAALRKDVPDPRTGLKERERRAVQASWKKFVSANQDYGVVIFSALFLAHPEYIELFSKFRGKTVPQLQDDPQFRAHGCAVGYQLSSMVDSLGDSVLLEALIRKNAIAHLERSGVHPFHFQSLGHSVIEALKARDEKSMNWLAVAGWEKLFAFMLAVTVKVFEECPQDKDTGPTGTHPEDASVDSPSGGVRTISPGSSGPAKPTKSGNKGTAKKKRAKSGSSSKVHKNQSDTGAASSSAQPDVKT